MYKVNAEMKDFYFVVRRRDDLKEGTFGDSLDITVWNLLLKK